MLVVEQCSLIDLSTFSNYILDRFALLAHPQSLILLPQFGQNQRSNGLNDAREDRVTRIEKPSTVGRSVQVDAALKDGVFADAQVASNRGHDEGRQKVQPEGRKRKSPRSSCQAARRSCDWRLAIGEGRCHQPCQSRGLPGAYRQTFLSFFCFFSFFK